MEIVIASTNLHKIREIKGILKNQYPFDFLSLLDFPDYKPPQNIGSTFKENAFIKATHAAKNLKKWVIADDSGLVIPALEQTLRLKNQGYPFEHGSDKENRENLIKALKSIPETERTGYYICALAFASTNRIEQEVKGLCEGFLTLTPRGRYGFGYDPLFLKYDYNKTFAEIDEKTKNKISHRRKALDKLSPIFESLLTQPIKLQ